MIDDSALLQRSKVVSVMFCGSGSVYEYRIGHCALLEIYLTHTTISRCLVVIMTFCLTASHLKMGVQASPKMSCISDIRQ